MKIRKFSTKTRDFIKNSGWMIFNRIYQMIFSLIVGSLTARYLGPSNYGIINYGLSYVNIFNTICALGLEGVIVKRVINKPEEEGTLIGTSILLRAIVSVLSIIGLIIFFYVSPSDKVTKVVILIQSISLIFNIYEIIELWLQAKLMSKYATISRCIAITCVGIWKITMLVLNVSVEFFAFTTIIESLVILVGLSITYIKLKGPKLQIKLGLTKTILQEGAQFLLSSLCIIIYTRMDKIMLGAFIDNASVGTYSASLTISELWQFIPMAIVNSSRPLLLQYKNEDEKKYVERIKLVYSIIIYMGLIVAGGITIFGKIALRILSGEEYLAAFIPLLILVWASIFAVLGSARTTWLITENKEKYLKIFVLIGAILNLLLNYMLIKTFTIVGVAIATLIAQVAVAILVPLIFKETRISTVHILQAINPIPIIKKYKLKKETI